MARASSLPKMAGSSKPALAPPPPPPNGPFIWPMDSWSRERSMLVTRESLVTCRGEMERSWESLEWWGWESGSRGRSFSLFDMSTGVRLSRKVSMSAVSLADGTLSARFPLDDVGGNRPGGVCGMPLPRESLGGEVSMFRSGFRRALRRAVSEDDCMVEDGSERGSREEMRT